MPTICNGNGECLTQTDDENTYGKSPDYTCEHNCKPLPCCNKIICDSQLPPWFDGLKKVGICICIHCDMYFGKKLEVVESTDCPVCLETKQGITMPNCTHSMCVDCFKRCWWGEDIPQPQFPYPDEVWDEWEVLHASDITKEFLVQYPLIKEWDKAWKKWEKNRDTTYEKEKCLRLCPYCRR